MLDEKGAARQYIQNQSELKSHNESETNNHIELVMSENDKKLQKFVIYLAKNKLEYTKLKEYLVAEILEIYKDPEFRHSYFVLSDTIHSICDVGRKGDPEAPVVVLGQNLELLKQLKDDQQFESVKKPLAKFYDHCRLEISRYTHFNSIFSRADEAQTEFNKSKEEVKALKEEAKAFLKEIEELKNQVDGSRAEYITILGIFAALLCASVGGLHIFSNTCSNLGNASWERVALILGFTTLGLFNTFAILIYLIAKITGKEECLKEHDPYIWMFNFIVILLMFLFYCR